MGGILQAVKTWFATPLQPMAPLTAAELTVVVLLTWFLWSRVMAHLHLE